MSPCLLDVIVWVGDDLYGRQEGSYTISCALWRVPVYTRMRADTLTKQCSGVPGSRGIERSGYYNPTSAAVGQPESQQCRERMTDLALEGCCSPLADAVTRCLPMTLIDLQEPVSIIQMQSWMPGPGRSSALLKS